MAINIKFDLLNNPEPPTLVLANRNGNKLGQLDVNPESVELIDKFNEASEVSFTVNKYVDGKITNLWDKLVDFKLIYCKEWDMWFECKVELDEATESVKTVFCTQLGQAELSQIMLYDIEINTEDDIARDDYKIGILYDPFDSQCILRRLLDKAPHYSIFKVDSTIANIQRSFSFNDISIYDAFQEIAEEIGCLFIFHSDSDEYGMPRRIISVKDLQQNCKNKDCGYRGEFTNECPKCGNTDIEYGYGDDTLIFVTSDELASEGIQLVTDVDSVKNCFKLEAGDDLMTATIRNRNPNGTDYIWHFSDATKEDMPDKLVEKIEEYDKKYDYFYNEYESNLNSDLLSRYNSRIKYYKEYVEGNKDLELKNLETISNPVVGFASLMNAYYNTIDFGWYLKSGMMPSVTINEGDAEYQGILLEQMLPNNIAVLNLKSVSLSTADSAALMMAKTIVSSSYKVSIKSSSLSGNKSNWSGSFTITSYSDENDTYTTSTIGCDLTDSESIYIKQRIEKVLNRENTDDVSITGLFAKDYSVFCEELHKYALAPLTSFHDACQACLDILIEQGAGKKDSDLYDALYYPYYQKLMAIESEIKLREDELDIVIDLQSDIEKIKNSIQSELNFEKYLGEDLWLQFCAYRREDKYSNPNYISDGLNNAELFKRALQFYEVAENEIFKSSELQHSISATLNNLLAIPKFKPLVESFEIGNWIRVQIDDYIYKLRLVEYEISYGDFSTISVKFSDVAKIKNGYSDLEDILNNASSMATSYDSIQRQANLGNDARDIIRQWLNEGLDASLIQIQNNTNEDVVIDNNGILGRSYSDITEEYSDEQIRITHNIIAFTDDNWETVKQAIGKHKYKYYDENKQWYDEDGNLIIGKYEDAIGFGVSADFVIAGVVTGSQIIGGDIYSPNYISGKSGTHFDLTGGDFELAGGRFVYDESTKKLTLKNVTIQWDSLDDKPAIENIDGLGEYLEELKKLGDQLDNRAETWYQDTDPSVEWETDEVKDFHLGDLWHYTGETGVVNGIERIKNSEWIWKKDENGNYCWGSIEISDDIFDAIDGKAQIFTNTPPDYPTPPYNYGDLWVQGSTGDILHCIKSKAEGESYSEDDWELSSKYTDDTVAKEALEAATKAIEDAASGLEIANQAKKTADGANSYTDTQITSLSETLKNAYETYTNTQISKLDDAVSNYLGLDGSTLITGDYIVSPYIGGGYLNITNTENSTRVLIDPNNMTNNGYVFQVYTGDTVAVGIDKDGTALFRGDIYANSLTLGSGVTIPYSKLTDTPTIPEVPTVEEILEAANLTDLNTENIVYKGDITQTSKTDDYGNTYLETTVPTANGNVTYVTYDAGDYIIFGNEIGENTSNGTYFCVEKDGLLTARNALIYGTVYATDGEFTGEINATSGTIGGWEIKDGTLTIPSDVLENISDSEIAKQIAAGEYSGGTFIDGKMIHSPEIYGSTIYGGEIYWGDDKASGGLLRTDGAIKYSDGTYSETNLVHIWTNEGMFIQATNGGIRMESSNGLYFDMEASDIRLRPTGYEGDTGTSWWTLEEYIKSYGGSGVAKFG